MDEQEEPNTIDSDVIGQPGNTTQPVDSGEVFQPNHNQATEPSIQSAGGGSKQNKWSTILIAAVAALVLIGGGAYFVWQALSSEEETITQTVKNEIPLLRISTQDGPLNLIYTGVDNDGALTVNSQIYEGLVAYENVSKIVPLLATSWTNPDDVTWVFTIKDNVRFHSGAVMTAEDVKYSLENAATVGLGELGSSIADVEIIDDNTIQITTTSPDPLLLGELANIWITSAEPTASDQYPDGTGPYIIKTGTTPTEESIELIAFNDYHGGIVYTKELRFVVLSTVDAIDAFNNQEIDIASTLVSNSEDLDLPNQTLVNIADFTVAFLGINSLNPASPLSKLEVRQAIEMAIDPEAVIEAQGVVGQVVDQFVTRDIPGYDTEISRLAYNVDEARQLIEDAGYPDGFTVSLSYPSSNNNGMFDSIQSQLAEIGITITKDFFGDDQAGFFDKVFGGQAELFFIAYGPDVPDASNTFSTVFGGGDLNPFYNNAEIDTLLEQAGEILDESQRLTILKQIAGIIHEDVASVALYFRDSTTAMAGNYVVQRDLPSSGSGFLFKKVYLP